MRILFLFSLIICVSGCLYHVLYLTDQYMLYKTITRVESNLQDTLFYPALIFCTRQIDLIDNTVLDNLSVSGEEIFGLTIGQIFTLTPKADDAVKECRMRIHAETQTKLFTGSNCSEFFQIKKYVASNYMCYQFHPKERLHTHISNAANAINYNLHVYSLTLTDAFNSAKVIFMPANYPSFVEDDSHVLRFPVQSRKFAEVFTRYNNYNLFEFRPNENYFTLLPAPYDTDCINENYFCFRDCVIHESIRALQRFPYTQPANNTAEYSSLMVLSSRDLENVQLLKSWMAICKKCEAQCSKLQCQTSITSNIVHVDKATHEPNIIMSVSVPLSYVKQISSKPSTSFIDYVSGISNSISIWFGFSILAVNPANLIGRIKMRFAKYRKISFLRTLHYVACIAGFLYQSGELCHQYFDFGTISQIHISNQDMHSYQNLGICYTLPHVANRSLHKIYNIYPTLGKELDHWEREVSSLTVAEWMAATPPLETFIRKCGIRDELNYGLNRYLGSDCYKYFTLVKAIQSETVCYFIVPNGSLHYSWTKSATSFKNRGRVYDIYTPIYLNSNMFVSLYSYEEKSVRSLPLLSRNFGQKMAIFPVNTILISSFSYTHVSMPLPYDTACKRGFGYFACHRSCMNASLQPINRLPFSAMFTQNGLNIKIVSVEDLKNKNISSLVTVSEIKCRKRCSKTPCVQTTSFTDSYSYHSRKRSRENSLRLISTVPYAPTLLITTIPLVYFIDFLQFLCNSFGIWFGFSVLSLITNVCVRFHWRTITFWPTAFNIKINITFSVMRNAFSVNTKILLWLLCLAGLVTQLCFLSNNYFRYFTGSRIEIFSRDEYRFPNIVICTHVFSLINTNVTLFGVDQLPISEYNLPTIREIMELTPNVNTSLVECSFRDFNSGIMRKLDGKECVKLWTVAKYVTGSYICYVFYSGLKMTYSLTAVSSALTEVGIIFKLYLNKSLTEAEDSYFINFAHPIGYEATIYESLPMGSRIYASWLSRDLSNPRPENYFIVQGTIHNITLLPDPYDTRCLMHPLTNFCVSQCNIEYKKTCLNRVPFNEMILEPLDMYMVSLNDFQNETFKQLIREGNDLCRKKCDRRYCKSYYSLTDAAGYSKLDEEFDGLIIAAGVPKSNELTVTTFPSLSLIDYLNNMAVSGSIWFGISLLSLSMLPFRIASHKEKKSKVSRSKRLSRVQRLTKIHQGLKANPKFYCPCVYCRKRVRLL